MASTPVEIQYQSGLTLTLELYPLGSDTIANGSGDSLTEATNRKGFYVATVTESLSGWHHVVVKDGSTAVANGYIYLTDTTDVHRTEAPPWSQLEGRVTVDVDLVDAPNATAVAAIQSGLATASALSTTDGKIDGIKAVTDKLDDLIEDASGYRFTEKALEEAPTGGSGGATAQEVWEYATRTLTALDEDSTTIDLDGAIQAATVGLDTKLDTIDGNVDAIKAVTDNLPDSGALTSLAAKTDLPANFADLSITATTGRVTVGTNADKTGYSLTGDYDAAKTAAQAGDEMALTTGALAAVNAAADQALSDYDPPTRAEATADKYEILGAVEEVGDLADAILDAVETDGVALTSTTMQAIADALLDRANAIDGATPRAALRYIAAVLAGKVSGAGTGIETFYGLDGTTPRVEVTVDVDGNRSNVDYDP